FGPQAMWMASSVALWEQALLSVARALTFLRDRWSAASPIRFFFTGGTLLALLRYGTVTWDAGEGKIDFVDKDVDVLILADSPLEWWKAIAALTAELENDGWTGCSLLMRESSTLPHELEVSQLARSKGANLFSRGVAELACALVGKDSRTLRPALVPFNAVWVQAFEFDKLERGRRWYRQVPFLSTAASVLASSPACSPADGQCVLLGGFPFQAWRGALPVSVLLPDSSCVFVPEEQLGGASLAADLSNCTFSADGSYQVSFSMFKGSLNHEADCPPKLHLGNTVDWRSPPDCPDRVQEYNDRMLSNLSYVWHPHGYQLHRAHSSALGLGGGGEEKAGITDLSVPQAPDVHPIILAVEALAKRLGEPKFKQMLREVFFGGEARIKLLTAWFTAKKNEGACFAIITAGVASSVSMALEAVPEWDDFFPTDLVLDVGACRHQVMSVTGQKSLMLRDLRPTIPRILLVDDSLGEDPPPAWVLRRSQVIPVALPYEGQGLDDESLARVDVALLGA
ncbi:SHL2, partial [Symbiodinium necroappetens]